MDASKYVHVKKIVLLSGKRKCGKDFIGEKLGERLRALLLHLSEPLKLQFAQLHKIDGEELLTASAYKEKYRQEMIKWGEEQRNKDPSVFCRLAIEQKEALCLANPIWIRYFPDRTVLVRIVACEEARKQRGWVFTANIDDAESECQLDKNVQWSFVFTNDHSDSFELQMNNLIDFIAS